jgi:hypothetical protein
MSVAALLAPANVAVIHITNAPDLKVLVPTIEDEFMGYGIHNM